MDSRIRKDPKFSWLTDVFQLCKEIYAKFNWGELTKMFVVFFYFYDFHIYIEKIVLIKE